MKGSISYVLLVLLALVVACGEVPTATPTVTPEPVVETVKAAFVYVGPVGDHGWTYAHDQGRKYLEANVSNVDLLGERQRCGC